jgi:hypothetical protein
LERDLPRILERDLCPMIPNRSANSMQPVTANGRIGATSYTKDNKVVVRGLVIIKEVEKEKAKGKTKENQKGAAKEIGSPKGQP